MEKTFANATLFSATVVAAFMIMIPINHLSAQADVKMDDKAKVHKATIQDFDPATGRFSIDLGEGAIVPVIMDASTSVYLGDGNEVSSSALRNGINVYVFGAYDRDAKLIPATKIVIRNKRITERTMPSRAQLEASTATNSPLELLGLSAR